MVRHKKGATAKRTRQLASLSRQRFNREELIYINNGTTDEDEDEEDEEDHDEKDSEDDHNRDDSWIYEDLNNVGQCAFDVLSLFSCLFVCFLFLLACFVRSFSTYVVLLIHGVMTYTK